MQIINLSNSMEVTQEVDSFYKEWNSSTSSLFVQTSGSTGAPKTIELQKKHMRASAQMTGEYFQFKPKQKIALSLSPKTIGGKMILVRAWLFDMDLVLLPLNRNPIETLEMNLDFIALVPMQLQTILAENPEKINLIKQVLIGGAPLSKQLEEKIMFFDTSFYESFGMTETMSHFAIRSVNHPPESHFNCLKQVSISTNSEQCLIVHAPQLGVENIVTNDEIKQINESSFVWLGRKDFVINSGGYKFHPERIERKIAGYFQGRFFVFGENDEVLGERIVMAVESDHQYSVQLNEVIQTILDKYEQPKHIYFLANFVETMSGKINRIKTIELIHG